MTLKHISGNSCSLEFSGGEAIFAKSREITVQNRLINMELLSSF